MNEKKNAEREKKKERILRGKKAREKKQEKKGTQRIFLTRKKRRQRIFLTRKKRTRREKEKEREI